ncbi:hypothetical protein [Nocardia jiangsuensis]|uniref:Uncharacterized protein n=1 Tax=Nocardia jiangsuensis TaxID=1691563 RepID=A0ABV8DWB9_9NOCA
MKSVIFFPFLMVSGLFFWSYPLDYFFDIHSVTIGGHVFEFDFFG